MIKGKTAALFAAACEVGAVVADRPQSEAAALAELRPATSASPSSWSTTRWTTRRSRRELGKTVGDDFREGKITLPVLLAFGRGDEAERDFWRRTLEERDQGPDDLAEAQRLIARHRALHDTVERARGSMATQALAALECFPDGPERRALADIVEFCIARAR